MPAHHVRLYFQTASSLALSDIFYSRQHISVLIKSGIHIVFALCWKETAPQLKFIDDALSINNPDFEKYLGQIYLAELVIKDTPGVTHLLPTWVYSWRSRETIRCALPFTTNARDDFNFHITNFSFLSSYIPSSPAYGVFLTYHTILFYHTVLF